MARTYVCGMTAAYMPAGTSALYFLGSVSDACLRAYLLGYYPSKYARKYPAGICIF